MRKTVAVFRACQNEISIQTSEQFRHRGVQTSGYDLQGFDRYVLLAAFDRAHIVSVQSAGICKALLGVAEFASYPSDTLPEPML